MDYAHQSRITSDNLMSGFDVPDEEDREYLTDLVIHGIGPEEDIKALIDIALYTGVEEWEHALARAEALREQAGEGDILSYLASVYGIDGALELSGERRKTESKRKSPRPEVQRKRVKRKISSSYWDDARCPQSDELTHLRKDSDPSRKFSQKDGQKEFEAQQKEYEAEQRNGNMLKGSRSVPLGPRTNAQNLSDDVLQEENGAHGGNLDASFGPGGSDNEDVEAYNCELRENNQHQEEGQEQEEGEKEKGEAEETSSPHKAISALKPNPDKEPRQSRTRTSKSHYFETITTTTLSTLPSRTKTPTNATTPKRPLTPFPPLTASQFGLIQEELTRDPFALLIAVTLLIRTSGRAAIPVFRALISAYPTPAAFACADTGDLEGRIRHLGLGKVRAATMQRYARLWLEREPKVGVRYRVKGYEGEWEVGHVTGGAYAVDSWRIFCRDLLIGEGEGEPEWMRVCPQDKELRAYLRWMWMREGWWWDPVTGERQVLGREVRRMVMEGRVGYDNRGELWVMGEGRRVVEFCED